jgi:hypothetical protein
MMKSVPVRSWKMACGLALGMLVTVGASSTAAAQPYPPPPAPAAAAPAVPPAEAYPVTGPGGPVLATAPAATGEATDHDSVVNLWGIEARTIGTFKKTAGEDIECPTPCTVDLNSVGVRKWINPHYAYSVGLAFGVGGGSRRAPDAVETLDTYFGVGPTVGASFLLANWKHLAVSMSPQLDAVYFLPSGKGSKSFLVNLRGVVEGELHLGMIGLPQASLGVSTGIVASFLSASLDEKTRTDNAIATRWSIGMTSPRSLWDLVTNATLRYYF